MIFIQKISGSLWQHYRDGPALDSINNIIDFPPPNNNNNNSISFKFKQKTTRPTRNDCTKDVELIVPLISK